MDKPGSLRDCQMTLLSRKVQDLTSAYSVMTMKLFNTENALNNVMERLLYLEDKQQVLFKMQKLVTSSILSSTQSQPSLLSSSSSSYENGVPMAHMTNKNMTQTIMEELEGVQPDVDTSKNFNDTITTNNATNNNNNNNNNDDNNNTTNTNNTNNNNNPLSIEGIPLVTDVHAVDATTTTITLSEEQLPQPQPQQQPQQQQQQPQLQQQPQQPQQQAQAQHQTETDDQKSVVVVADIAGIATTGVATAVAPSLGDADATGVGATDADPMPVTTSDGLRGNAVDASLAIEPPISSTTPPLTRNLALVSDATGLALVSDATGLALVSEPLSPPAIASPPPPRIHTYQQSIQLPFEAIPTNAVADGRDFAVDAVSTLFLSISIHKICIHKSNPPSNRSYFPFP